MAAPGPSSSRPGSAPPQAPPATTSARSPPANQLHLPTVSSPLSPHARRFSNETQTRSSVNAALQQVSSHLQAATGSNASRKGKGRILGIQDRLRKEADGVVKRRQGGVLARGFILKTDHYPTGRALDLDLTIQGAPNFRAPDEESLNVFGVAQPTTIGLQSILTILGCQPSPPPILPSRRVSDIGGPGAPLAEVKSQPITSDAQQDAAARGVQDGKAIWFSTREETLVYCNGRPYVLRDASNPFQTLALSDRASNLEDIERRLKLDILDESRKFGGMILTHDEVSNGTLIPTWMSVDEASIRTPKEVYEDIKREGWRVDYHRIPIAPDRPIEDNYLDAYVSVLKDADPVSTSLVFNCGMGVVRTTFGMCAALLVRRRQVMRTGLEDPFPSGAGASGLATPSQGPQAAQFLEQATHHQALNKSLLKLTRILEKNLTSKHPSTAIDLLASQPSLLEQLRKAHMGNYQLVLSLLSSLDHGRQMKRIVDTVIDNCDAVVNLRENVIDHRIKYSVSAMDDKNRQAVLTKALRSLEQYFDLIVFASYVEEEDAGASGVTFSSWLKSRPEIWNQIKVMRRSGGNRLFAFAPANDLSLISRSSDYAEGSMGKSRNREGMREMDLQGGKVLGDEWAEHVVENRNGIMLRASTLLKSDLWLAESASSSEGVRGAVGFRMMKGSAVFATGQPTQDGLSTILRAVHDRCPTVSTIVWVCLREEPLVMINGSPYCLRRNATALRNMRDYTGVSTSRLETLEDRLRSDVIAEIEAFQGRVLLHTESADGEVVPVWETVERGDVHSLRDVMAEAADAQTDVKLNFVRIPITSESSPDFHDITQLLDVCQKTDLETSAIVLNDQLGRGRSSTTSVIVLLIQRWMRSGRESVYSLNGLTPRKTRHDRNRQPIVAQRTSWQIINSCIRCIRNGLEVKRIVDEAIDCTAAHFNLRDTIEDFRIRAEEAEDTATRNSFIEKGIYHLRRYYHLLLFQAYLDDRSPDDEEAYSFESFIKHRPVFKTIEKELEEGGLQGLTPIDRVDVAEGMALPDEVAQVVANRGGSVLSAQTILKSDFFSGLQKQSLPERVDGAANYRKVPLTLGDGDGNRFVYGTGMPSAAGLRNALKKMDASPNGSNSIMWTSLREEPVLYIKSRPHVLRLLDKPLSNVETTGITAKVVERMEEALKRDVLEEIRAGDGRLLLHDEVETKPGTYEIIPIWEAVDASDVMTPKELYQTVTSEAYNVDYQRVAVTDEQAPLPATLQAIVMRVATGLERGSDFVFNCQMGRGRTTTGMIVASLIATVQLDDMMAESTGNLLDDDDESSNGDYSTDASQYLNGEYKTILQLVTVLSHGKQAKRMTDKTINQMEGVQNLRKAVYDFKLKAEAAEQGSAKYKTLSHQGINYLYRYGTIIVLANFLLETKEQGIPLSSADFPQWIQQHREISSVLSKSTLE